MQFRLLSVIEKKTVPLFTSCW